MKRKVVITMVLVASLMVSAVPAFAVKAEAKPERAVAVKPASPGPTMPELPEVPFAVKAEAKPERALAVKAEAKPERAATGIA